MLEIATPAPPIIALGTVGYAIAALFALMIATGLVVVLWRDLTRFEIDFAALALASLPMLALTLLLSGPEAALAALAVAALFGTLAEAVRRLRPGRMGAGDPWAFAALGLAAGPDHAIVTLLTCSLLCLVTSITWSLRRGKRLFRSMFPAALALVPAMAIAVALRFADAGGVLPPLMDRQAVPLSPETAGLLVVAAAVLLGLGSRARLSRWAASLAPGRADNPTDNPTDPVSQQKGYDP